MRNTNDGVTRTDLGPMRGAPRSNSHVDDPYEVPEDLVCSLNREAIMVKLGDPCYELDAG